jgi:hypothetical protein
MLLCECYLDNQTKGKATDEECDPYVENLMSFTHENAIDL